MADVDIQPIMSLREEEPIQMATWGMLLREERGIESSAEEGSSRLQAVLAKYSGRAQSELRLAKSTECPFGIVLALLPNAEIELPDSSASPARLRYCGWQGLWRKRHSMTISNRTRSARDSNVIRARKLVLTPPSAIARRATRLAGKEDIDHACKFLLDCPTTVAVRASPAFSIPTHGDSR